MRKCPIINPNGQLDPGGRRQSDTGFPGRCSVSSVRSTVPGASGFESRTRHFERTLDQVLLGQPDQEVERHRGEPAGRADQCSQQEEALALAWSKAHRGTQPVEAPHPRQDPQAPPGALEPPRRLTLGQQGRPSAQLGIRCSLGPRRRVVVMHVATRDERATLLLDPALRRVANPAPTRTVLGAIVTNSVRCIVGYPTIVL